MQRMNSHICYSEVMSKYHQSLYKQPHEIVTNSHWTETEGLVRATTETERVCACVDARVLALSYL